MAIIHESEVINLGPAYSNIKRLAKLGYADSRVTGLTTVASLITDIETFRDSSLLANESQRCICDAAVDSIRWLGLMGILTTVLVTALTTVDDITVSATTDLGYIVRGHAQFPASFGTTSDDLSFFQPAS